MTLCSKTLFCLFFLYISLFSKPISVLFLNPGAPDDPFFSRMTDVMKAASADLNIHLEIIHSGRDYVLGLEKLSHFFESRPLPDYLLLINEDGVASVLLETANRYKVKTILFNEGLSLEDSKRLGTPSDKLPYWIAQILPDDEYAGYLLAKALFDQQIKQHPNKPFTVFALEGSPRTNSSLLRKKGFERALKEYPQAHLLQSVPAHWSKEKAERIMVHAINRYPSIDVVLSASDLMAEGAYISLCKAKKKTIIGGIDWATFAFDRIKNRQFGATVGGHFFDGAWALLLAHDHFNLGTLDKKTYYSQSFMTIYPSNLNQNYSKLTTRNWQSIDFMAFSKKANATRPYSFNLKEVF